MPRVVPSQIVEFIDQTIPTAKNQTEAGGKGFSLNRNHEFSCAALVNLIEQLPPELLVLSSQQYTELVSSIAAINSVLEIWKLRDHGLDKIPGFGDYNPVSLIRHALMQCPDEFPSKDTAELRFIEDNNLRSNLEIDISATNQALSNGEWKATTVLAGSVIEALLSWELKKHDQDKRSKAVMALLEERTLTSNPGGNLDKWNLHSFIEVAAKLKLIGDDTAQQARLAREYRNLIHPGREKRLGQKCDRETALSAVAAVERVITDLSS